MQTSTKDRVLSESTDSISEPVVLGSAELQERTVGVVEINHRPMKRLIRNLLRRILSPRAFQRLRYWSWCLFSYLPGLVVCKFVARRPEVRGFRAPGSDAHLAAELRNINVLAPTKMCRIMTKYGSDKGRLHKYTTVYSALFMERCNEPLRILELGLGTNNQDVPSNMGVFGAPGASLRGWRELFPDARVYGADIDRRILFQEGRIKTFFCDQLDRSSVAGLWSEPDLQGGTDIIIEDGLHTFEANIAFLQGSLDRLRPGGIYITEDIMSSDFSNWCHSIENIYSKQYPNFEFAFVTLPIGKSQSFSNLLVIRRAAN